MKVNAIKLMTVTLAMVLLAGCTQNQILASLEASVAATEVLIGTLEVTGRISPTVADELQSAIFQLPAAYSQTAAELASNDSAATKAAKVTAYYADTLTWLNALPPSAQIYAEAISASIEAFLSSLHPADANRMLARGTVVMVNFDSKSLEEIGVRAASLQTHFTKLKARSAMARNGAAQ